MHRNGCCVIKKCMEFGSGKEFLSMSFNCFDSLCLDQYGNYVIQQLLEFIKDEIVTLEYVIKEKIISKFILLSCHKYGSNVIEKVLDQLILTGSKVMFKFIDIILSGNNLLNLLNDKYGNYVVQTCLEYQGEGQLKIAKEISKIISNIAKVNIREKVAIKINAIQLMHYFD